MIALFHSKKKGSSNESNRIYDERWFIDRMKERFETIVPEKSVAYEAYTFTHEEMDDSLMPLEDLEQLPDPFLLQTYLYVDQEDLEWIAGIVIEENTRKLLYEIWFKNGKAMGN